MNIKASFFALFILTVSLDAASASDIVAAKISDNTLSLTKGDKRLICRTQFKYKELQSSNDSQFLTFNLSYPKFKNPSISGFSDVMSAFNSCVKGEKIAIKPAPDYERIIDVNKKSNILITNEVYLYNTGGNTISMTTVARVWNYATSKEIKFPFSPSRANLKSIAKSTSDSNLSDKVFDSPTPIESLQENPKAKINVISPDGKYIAPVGVICEPFSGDIWDVEKKQPIIMDDLDSDALAVKCKEIFK